MGVDHHQASVAMHEDQSDDRAVCSLVFSQTWFLLTGLFPMAEGLLIVSEEEVLGSLLLNMFFVKY